MMQIPPSAIVLSGAGSVFLVVLSAFPAQSPMAARLKRMERVSEKSVTARVAVIEKVKPAVTAIFSSNGQGGGSGVVIDAVRCAKLALDHGISGALEGPSAYFMKSPPVQHKDEHAREMTEAFIRATALLERSVPASAGE